MPISVGFSLEMRLVGEWENVIRYTPKQKRENLLFMFICKPYNATSIKFASISSYLPVGSDIFIDQLMPFVIDSHKYVLLSLLFCRLRYVEVYFIFPCGSWTCLAVLALTVFVV